MPSAAFKTWNDLAQMQIAVMRSRINGGYTIEQPVNCCALFYREALTGDAAGYYQALADALEDARVVHDDVLIVSWDGSRLFKDAKNPRVEVTLTTA